MADAQPHSANRSQQWSSARPRARDAGGRLRAKPRPQPRSRPNPKGRASRSRFGATLRSVAAGRQRFAVPALYRAAHLKDPLERALLSRPPFRQASVNVFTCSVLVRVDPGTDAEATRQQIERLILPPGCIKRRWRS